MICNSYVPPANCSVWLLTFELIKPISNPSDRDEVHQVNKITQGESDNINVIFLIYSTICSHCLVGSFVLSFLRALKRKKVTISFLSSQCYDRKI